MSSGADDPRCETSGPEPGSIEDRLVRVLDTPHLAEVVPHLPAETLHQLIRYRGVEECGELLAAATPAQLESVLDLDLWRSAEAGLDEQFDAVRFAEWLESLVQAGDTQAAAIVSRIDLRLVVTGLSGHIRVFDPATRPMSASAEDETADGGTAQEPDLSVGVGGYAVQPRRSDSWDAIVALLIALDADHPDFFHAVMRGCRRLSNSKPEADGLDDLPTASGQLCHDVGLARNDRRSHKGFLSPAEARAFLQMARRPPGAPSSQAKANPIAAAYFRACETAAPAEGDAVPSDLPVDGPPAVEVRETVEAVAALVAEAARPPQRPRAMLGGPAGEDSRRTRVHALMEVARVSDAPAFMARSREVAFLANALMAGCSVQARPFTPQEASDAALACCNLGIDLWASVRALPDSFLSDHDLLTVFQGGWAALHEASLFVAQRLVEVLGQVRTLETKTHEGLVILRRELERCCVAGTPWGVRDALDVLAILDTVAWTGVLGALDECPVVPDALTAVVERRKGTVSATAFAFVSSADQIATMRAFADRLADVFLEP